MGVISSRTVSSQSIKIKSCFRNTNKNPFGYKSQEDTERDNQRKLALLAKIQKLNEQT